ncbi:PH domain-containing protein [Neurospora crassa OR74A]|uniref:PH domain-containing protein n=1 Tax=Neurospora crassa (strain ATCC 24698 / 74-OR23-1A / CBS 708.71 / DSM 1257 / FGSC 987) TaxID=367110 RepID=Q7SB17_NEUCR|nr:PH domain-containing protein [Neurospora crassa OR74A]EAA33573.1 PH domain-containing protein [Neurospora crassa OR74A]KAK3505294.1 hypothetical protein B0T13DRAFT_34474 [Neurospora crassa]|eukprot:XP_962809.1 PH domain-containing protein [Neurospora crassa OR74A]
MTEMYTQPPASSATASLQDRRVSVATPPSSIPMPPPPTGARLRSGLAGETYSPVNQNGSFEFDRVIKSGYVQKRTSKTKAWRTIYLVLRPNTLSIYKSDKEEKLRHKIYLSDLTAVTFLKDPKQKRPNVFGLFSPAKNFHFQAPTLQDAQEWVDLIRKDARIEEEEEELFLASPPPRRQSDLNRDFAAAADRERLASSSPEPLEPPVRILVSPGGRRSSAIESSGMSGTELASHSDFSDSEFQRIPGPTIESLTARSPSVSQARGRAAQAQGAPMTPGAMNVSQSSGINVEQDPDRIIWQGWLRFLRSKRGVKQWKKSWAVLRPRNLILYKDESEYSVLFVVAFSSIVNVVDIDPLSKSKAHCMQIITDEKSYRFCAQNEEELVQCLGAFKSLLAKRRELESKAAASTANATTDQQPRLSA